MEKFNKRENSQEELDKFKNDINIVDYALNQGYSIVKEKDSKNFRALRKDDDVVIVSKLIKSGHSWYFNQHDPDDKGTIIDFVKTRNNADLGQTRQILRDYTNAPQFTPSPNYKPIEIKQTEKEKNLIMEEFLKLDKKLTDRTYLKSRGITDETLDQQAFQGKIFTNRHVDKSGQTHINTAFPIFDAHGMVSVEQKNAKYKGIVEDTKAGQGVWISGNTEGDKKNKLDKLVISESSIDSLSYHQLKHQKGENSMYVSTIGYVSETRMELLQQIVDKRKPEQVIVAVDNDTAGSRYRMNLLNTIQPPREFKEIDGQRTPVEKDKYLEFKATEKTKFESKVDVTIRHENAEERDKVVKDIKDRIWVLNNGNDGEKLYNTTIENYTRGNRKLEESSMENIKKETIKEATTKTLITGDEDIKWGISKSTEKESHIRILVKNPVITQVEELVHNLKKEYDKKLGIDKEYIVIEKPNQKDFNDDLRAKNLTKENVLDPLQKAAKISQVEDKAQNNKIVPEQDENKNKGESSKFSLNEVKDSKNILDQSPIVAKVAQVEEKHQISKAFIEQIENKNKTLEASAPTSNELKDSGHRITSLNDSVQISSKQIESIANNTKNNIVDFKINQETENKPANIKLDDTKQIPPKEYFKMLDNLEVSMKKDGKFDEMKDKVNLYRHYPHLTDDEVDKYVSIKEKLEKESTPEKQLNQKKQMELE